MRAVKAGYRFNLFTEDALSHIELPTREYRVREPDRER